MAEDTIRSRSEFSLGEDTVLGIVTGIGRCDNLLKKLTTCFEEFRGSYS